MTATVLVSLLAVGLAVMARPGFGLGVLLASSLLWPEYLRMPLGVVQMSAPRWVALALVLRHASRWFELRKGSVDLLVIGGYVLSIVAVVATDASSRLVTSTIGRGLDTVLMYAAARLCLARSSDIRDMRWPLVATAVAIGLLAFREATARQFLFGWAYFGAGYAAVEVGQGRGGVGEMRWGFMRAQLSTSHPIYFGVAMTVVLGYIIAVAGWLRPLIWWVAVVGAGVGVFFSLSSGPWTAALLLLAVLPIVRRSWLVRPVIGVVLALCLLLEVASNRHFYHLICYIGLSNATAWYRVRLLEVAAKYLPEYWLFGYGGRSFDHWGLEIDGRYFIDCVNNYVLVAAMSGLPAMLCYLGAKVFVVWWVVRSWSGFDPVRRRAVSALMATMIAVSIGECSVSVFGPALLFNAVLLGSVASSAGWRSGALCPRLPSAPVFGVASGQAGASRNVRIAAGAAVSGARRFTLDASRLRVTRSQP